MADKNQLMVHCGGKLVTMEQLQEVELPEQTSTYSPVGHYELSQFVRQTAVELLRAEPVRESYALAKDGQRMFGLQVFGKDQILCSLCEATGKVMTTNMEDIPGPMIEAPCPECNGTGWAPGDEYGFGIAFRNSYDKSMSIGMAAGFSVFICDNLAISGEINVIRKHTKGAWEDIDKVLVHSLFRKGPALREQFAEDVDFFKNREVPQVMGYRALGLLMGNKVLGATQTGMALYNWNKRDHQNHLASGWDFYNDCTAVMKSCPPNNILERHRQLHDLVKLELQ